MLSIETEARVAKILITIAENEKEIEINRKYLSDNFEFDPYQIFKILDKEGKNRIDICNLIDFLNYKEIYCNEYEISLIIFFYDQDNDGALSYIEFLNLIKSDKSIIKTNRNSNFKQLSFDIEYSLCKLFEKEIEFCKKIIFLLQELKSRKDFNIHNIFHLIKGYSSITPDNLRNFLVKNNADFNNDDINAIMKRLDINHDGRIDLCEFHSFFGFPSCVKCCSLNPCSYCGCCCCNECYCDPCYSFCNNTKIKNNVRKNYNLNVKNDISKKTEDILNNNSNNYQNYENSTFYKSYVPEQNDNNNYIKDNQNIPKQKINSINPNIYSQNLNSSISQSKDINSNIHPNIYSQNSNLSQSKDINSNLSQNQNINPFLYQENFINSNIPQQDINIPQRETKSNISLRLSPQRIYSPLNYCNICKNNPCICKNNNYSPIKFNTNNLEQKDNLNKEEKLLFEYLKNLINAEKRIEDSKIELAKREDFNCEDAFRIFDINNKNCLTNEDIKKGLSILDIYASDSDIRNLMKRFDLSKKGYLNYVDFFDMVVPYDKNYRNIVEKRKPKSCCPCKSTEIFMFTTKLFLKNLLKDLIDYENKFNIMRKKLFTLTINLNEIFNNIDINNLGYFYEENLYIYLDKNGLIEDENDSDLLFIRLDKNRDGTVDFNEFEDEFKPQI